MAGQSGIERIGKSRHRPLQAFELCLSVLDTHKCGGQVVHHATQARVGREPAQKRLRCYQLIQTVPELRDIEIQESFAVEERSAVGAPHRPEETTSSGELVRKLRCRLLRPLRRCAIDHDQDEIVSLWKRTIELGLADAPRHIRRYEHLAVAVHGKVARRIHARGQAQHECPQCDPTCIPAAERNNCANEGRQHQCLVAGRTGHDGMRAASRLPLTGGRKWSISIVGCKIVSFRTIRWRSK